MAPWRVAAVNLAEHADNIIHTDEGARAAGFEGALVAGTTIHAYLTHPVAEAWGTTWLDSGWSQLRLIAPVLDGDVVELRPASSDAGQTIIEAVVADQLRATLEVAPGMATPMHTASKRPAIQEHPERVFDLSTGLGDYGIRAGDDLGLYAATGRVHPTVWPSIGNAVTKAHHVDGPWVHVRSTVQHLGPTRADADVVVSAAVVDRFDSRAGERVVLDLLARVDDAPVARIEHESIVRLR